MRCALLLLPLGACSLLFEGADQKANGDAAPGSVDAGPQKSFMGLVEVSELNTGSDELGPVFDEAGTLIYFASDRLGSLQLFTATRGDLDQPFGNIAEVAELNGDGVEYDATVSRDELELYFVSSNTPFGLRRATRNDTSDPWSSIEVVAGGGERESPKLFANDTRLILSTPTGIEEWQRADTSSTWTLAHNHDALDGLAWPGIRQDGLELYAPNRASGTLRRAERASIDEPFGTPVLFEFGSLLDGERLVDPDISFDGQSLILSHFNGADFDLYMSSR